MEDAVIIAAARSPLTRAYKGSFRTMRIDDIAAQVIKRLITSVPGLGPGDVEDVLVGCAMPEGEQGYNVARQVALLAGMPVDVGAATINRFCASSLDAINHAALAIGAGQGECFIAGGIESMTHVPMGGFNPSFNERLMSEDAPDAYIAMGETAENLARHYAITREDQDQFALGSHRKASVAQTKGIFDGETAPIEVLDEAGEPHMITRDEGPRPDTSLEALGALKPAFAEDGTVTAGNASSLTDGAAFTLITRKKFAKKLGVKPLARIRASAVAGVDPAVMGLGPVQAVPKALKRARMKLSDIHLVELNEAFAAQSLAVMRELDLDERVVNVHGGAIALGHPLGASGARIVVTALNAMRLRDADTALCTMCVGGGQGIATILERM